MYIRSYFSPPFLLCWNNNIIIVIYDFVVSRSRSVYILDQYSINYCVSALLLTVALKSIPTLYQNANAYGLHMCTL